VRLVSELAAKLVEESRLAEACLSDQEARLAAPLARGLEGGAQRRELLLAPHQRREARRGDGVDAPADGAVGDDAVHANGLGPALDLLLALVLELEEARDEPPDRLGDQDLPGIRARLEARGQVRGVAHGGVVHAQVVADATHDHRAGVDADPHLELDAVVCLHLLVQRRKAALDPQRGQHGAAGGVLERDRGAEEREDPIAEELVHGALVAVHFLEHEPEGAIHERVHLLGPEAFGERRRVAKVREEHGDVLALAFEGATAGEDALGQMLRCVGAGHALVFRGFDRSRRHAAGPGECASVPHGHPLDLDQLLDQLNQGVVVELKLALEGAERDAPVTFQERPCLLDGFQEAHRPRFSMPQVRFYAPETFPVSPIH